MVASVKFGVGTLAFAFALSFILPIGASADDGVREPGVCKTGCTSFPEFFGSGDRGARAIDGAATSAVDTQVAPSKVRPAQLSPAQPALPFFAPPAAAATSSLEPPTETGPTAESVLRSLFAPPPVARPATAERGADREPDAAARPARPTRTERRRATVRTRAARSGKRSSVQAAAPRPIVSLAQDLSGPLADDIARSSTFPVDLKRLVGRAAIDTLLDPKGPDLAVTSTVALKRALVEGDTGKRLRLVAKLYTQELHLIARIDVGAVEELDGKPVAVGEAGSATALAARDVFAALNLKPFEVNAPPEEALKRLRTGEVAAAILVAGMPSATIANLAKEEQFTLLPVPFAPDLQSDYYPTVIAAEAYPNLLPEGERVDTVAIGTVLVARDKPADKDREQRLTAFVDSFFGGIETLAGTAHPKWREVNLAALVPGLARYEPAAQWLTARTAMPERRPMSSVRIETSATR